MTEFHVEVVQIGKIFPHPNADTLSIALIHEGYPVVHKTGEYKEGQLAVYLPVDCVVPENRAEFLWLGSSLSKRTIKAKNIRNVFSMGLLCPITIIPESQMFNIHPGLDVAEMLGIRRREDIDAELAPRKARGGVGGGGGGGHTGPVPNFKFPLGAYDLEGWRRLGKAFFTDPEEEVVITEKIHGQNARFYKDFDGNNYVGSRNRWLQNDTTDNTWAKVAEKYKIFDKLPPGLLLFGETYGNNADMPYGVDRAKDGDAFVAFDIYDTQTGQWLDCAPFFVTCTEIDIPVVPILFSGRLGELSPEVLKDMAEGNTTLSKGEHVREGWVIKPTKERKVEEGKLKGARIALKLAGEGYLTRP